MNFEEWQEAYHTKKIFDIFSEFSNDELETLKKLGITIENKVYTEYEYETIKLELGKYYKEDDMDQEELDMVESLSEKNVTDNEYKAVIEKFDMLDKKYENQFNKIKF